MNAVLPKLEATRPLRWSQCAITFNSADQLKCAATAGTLPMLCSPVISNVQVTKTLIDDGAGLSVLSVDTFDNLRVPYEQLQPTKPFSGVTDGSTMPIGQVCPQSPLENATTTAPSSSTSTSPTFAYHTTPSSDTQIGRASCRERV